MPKCFQDVYTFCSPRTGNPAFAEILQTELQKSKINFWRIQNMQDLVP